MAGTITGPTTVTTARSRSLRKSSSGGTRSESATATLLSSSHHHLILSAAFQMCGLIAAWNVTLELRLLLNFLAPISFSRSDLMRAAPPLPWTFVLWAAAALWLSWMRRDGDTLVPKTIVASFQSALLASTILIVVIFFSREYGVPLSRSFVALFLPVSCACMSTAAYAQKMTTHVFELLWPARERVAVFGRGPHFRRLAAQVTSSQDGPYLFRGLILCDGSSAFQLVNGRVLGTTRQLGEVINRERLDRIVVADQDLVPRRELDACLQIAKRMGVTVSVAVPEPGLDARIEFRAYPGVHVLDLKPIQFTRRQELMKRCFDLLTATACLLLVFPLMAVVAVLIKITSKGPVLYKAPRVGRGGRHFIFFKFRSMYVTPPAGFLRDLNSNNEKDGHIFKLRDDPRVTPVGRWIRKYSVDELPQLINVIRGDMSLIGPRPLPAQDLDPDGQSRRFRYWSDHRSRVPPGITGLWQVSGRGDLTFERMMELDVEYIRNWSLPLDLRILLATPKAVLAGRGAY